MSRCCDGTNTEACACPCHDLALDFLGFRARILHPLLDPGRPAPEFTEPVPPVDPRLVRYPLQEVRLAGRVIGYMERDVVTITDELALRMIDSGAALAVSVDPMTPDWSAVDEWLEPGKLDP